jgi:hypothetical protein
MNARNPLTLADRVKRAIGMALFMAAVWLLAEWAGWHR